MRIKVLLLFFAALALPAGELTVLENLGFSADSRYFMFGQHVLTAEDGMAYAETAIVDIARNEFVPEGWKKSGWEVAMLPHQNSRGALYELLSESVDIKQRYKISHLEQGRLLYTRGNGDAVMEEESSAAAMLSFRDFVWGEEYELRLYQTGESEGDEVSAAFHIELTVTDSAGRTSTHSVGRPDFMRSGISAYSVVRVWMGPRGKSLIIVVAKEAADLSVRYMVETLVLRR